MTEQHAVLVRVYCDGAFHQPLETRVSYPATKAEIRALMRRAGWTVKSDGRTYCSAHRPS